jgi:DUF4097 and DUF4098 domain-containing protein YvlB
MRLTLSSRLPLVTGLIGAALSAGCVDIVATGSQTPVDRQEKRFQVSGRPEVVLSTFDGSIEVRPWDRPEVLVEIEKYAVSKESADDIEVVAAQDGNRVSVEARLRDSSRHLGFSININRSARLIVSVPASADLIASSGDGSIDVERVAGRIELRSGDGSINGRELTGELRLHTGDGSIRLEGIEGTMDATTGDGTIVAQGTLSKVRARTGDGSVNIHANSGSAVKEDWSISTGDGSVTLELPDAFDAEIDAHTGDGSVSVRGAAVSNTIEKSKRSMRGTLGNGGRALRVRTGDGAIVVRRS